MRSVLVKYKLGAKTYRSRNAARRRNPALSSIIMVNGRRAARRGRRRDDAISDALRLGLLGGKGKKRRNARKRRRVIRTAAGSTLGQATTSRRRNRRKRGGTASAGRAPVRRRRNRRQKGTSTMVRRRRNRRRRSAGRRRNTTVRRRRRAARRANSRRVRRRRRNRRAAPRVTRRRRRNRRSTRRAAPRRRRRRNAARRAPTRRRRRKNARRRVSTAPRRRRRRRNARRRAYAAPRRRRARKSNRRAPARRKRRSRRRNAFFAMPFRTRGYIGGRRRNTRRRRNTSMVSGAIGHAKSTFSSAGKLVAAGVNVGAGFLATTALAGLVEGVTGGRLGRFNGIGSTLVAILAAKFIPDHLVKKIPYASKTDMMIGIGLYGAAQIAGLLLPESWRARLGLSGFGEYLRGPMGDYIGLPGGPSGMMQTVGGLGNLSEYVSMGNINAAGQAQADVAAAQSMAASNPTAVADALLDQAEIQEATFSGMLGEYVQTGASIGAGAGGLGGGYNGGMWLGQGQYASFAYPDPPASRFLDYGNTFRGLGLGPAMSPNQPFARMPGAAVPPPIAMTPVVPGASPALAPPPVASTPFSPVMDMCGPCPPGACDPVTGQPIGVMGPCGDQLYNGCMPTAAQLCPTAPVGNGCGPIEAGGLFQQPWQNLIAQP